MFIFLFVLENLYIFLCYCLVDAPITVPITVSFWNDKETVNPPLTPTHQCFPFFVGTKKS